MKDVFYYCMLCLVAISTSCSSDTGDADPETEFLSEVVEINAPSLASSLVVNQTSQKAKVLLPPFYNAHVEKRYPVIYFIHGYGDNYAYDYGIFKAAYDEMVAETINEFIVVTVNSNCDIGGTFCVNSPVTGNWETHISAEVVSYIDANYRTLAKKESRGIVGFSMGGFGALYLGLRNADVYNLVYAIAPGVFNKTDFEAAYNGWRSDGGSFINAYGAAFSPNLDLAYPHAEKPVFNGTPADSLIIENWNNGFGNFEQKLVEYQAGNHELKKIGLDYGLSDYYSWIPRGCIYLAELLEEKGIAYEVHARTLGSHEVNADQVKTYMLPFFSDNLLFE